MFSLRRHAVVTLTIFFCGIYFNWRVLHNAIRPFSPHAQQHHAINPRDPFQIPLLPDGQHPIETLMESANHVAELNGAFEPKDFKDAVRIYRQRRGRHPPPRFDEWYRFAKEHHAFTAEYLFDQIHHDLEPLWSEPPTRLRKLIRLWPHRITLRSGSTMRMSPTRHTANLDDWKNMIDNVARFLPDMDLAMNLHEEPLVYAPWGKIDQAILVSELTRNMRMPTPETKFTSQYSRLKRLSLNIKTSSEELGLISITNSQQLWPIVRDTCPPGADAHLVGMPDSFDSAPAFQPISPLSFVANWTHSKSICYNPDIRLAHSALTAPKSKHVFTTLFPLFSASKMQGVNNDILIPAAAHWAADTRNGFSAPTNMENPWSTKKDIAFWRGAASGGKHDESNWKPFPRNRLVAMMNSTQVALRERLESEAIGSSLSLPDHLKYMEDVNGSAILKNYPWIPANFGGRRRKPFALSKWVNETMDASFVHYRCDIGPPRSRKTAENPNPHIPKDSKHDELPPDRDASEAGSDDPSQAQAALDAGISCPYLSPYYSIAPSVRLEDQLSTYKYLPDVDGDAHSSRFRTYLQSGGLPIKATIFQEWHDSRIIPWRHFVPMRNDLSDWWGLMGWFLGFDGEQNATSGTGAKQRRDAEHADGPQGRSAEQSGGAGVESAPDGTTQSTTTMHDAAAKQIADQGSEWAGKALRKEDILVYTYRLLLEYGRITNDNRDWLAYVDDLVLHAQQ